mmetsp:Transcript_23409/g.61106  ORF Transcript_23409/g.61106 Transcript_23409/m.61106 type:complete len:290 (+) Transcript_23409:64-933(+)
MTRTPQRERHALPRAAHDVADVRFRGVEVHTTQTDRVRSRPDLMRALRVRLAGERQERPPSQEHLAARRRRADTDITRLQALLEDNDGVGAARQRKRPIVVRGPVRVRQHVRLLREIVRVDQNVVRNRSRRRVARRGGGAGVARPPRERLRREAGLPRRAAQPSQSSAAHRDPVVAAFCRGHDRCLLGLADPVGRVGDRRRRAGENLQRWPRSTGVEGRGGGVGRWPALLRFLLGCRLCYGTASRFALFGSQHCCEIECGHCASQPQRGGDPAIRCGQEWRGAAGRTRT